MTILDKPARLTIIVLWVLVSDYVSAEANKKTVTLSRQCLLFKFEFLKTVLFCVWMIDYCHLSRKTKTISTTKTLRTIKGKDTIEMPFTIHVVNYVESLRDFDN